MLEEPVEEAVESHDRLRYESLSKLPSSVGDLLAELLLERNVCIPGQWRRVAMEDDRKGATNSHSIASLQLQGGLAVSDSEKALADSLGA
jgi:hypothetical protein